MVKKGLKIVSVLLVVLFFSFSYVFATDINLNIPGTTLDTTNTNIDNSVSNQDNVVDNQNATIDNITTDTTDDFQNEVQDDVYDPYDDTETLTPNNVNTSSQSGLAITDIINILLITVGVILILLAIAIIIRLK